MSDDVTGPEIDDGRHDYMNPNGTWIGALLLMIACVVGFILGVVVKGFLF